MGLEMTGPSAGLTRIWVDGQTEKKRHRRSRPARNEAENSRRASPSGACMRRYSGCEIVLLVTITTRTFVAACGAVVVVA